MSAQPPDTDLRMVLYDAVTAYGDACDELADAFHDREGVDRDLVVTLEDGAGRAREAIDRAVEAVIANAEARGRAEALAEVDTACAHLFADPKGPGWNLELIGPWPDDPPGTPWRLRTCPIDDYTAAPTPTAAILAAAAAVLDETAR